MSEVLTTNLRLELEKTDVAFSRWAEKQVDWISSTDAHFSNMMEECDCTIAALHANDRQLEEVRGQNELIKAQQTAEVEACLTNTERLKQQKKTLESQLRKFEDEEAQKALKLEQAREELAVLRDRQEKAMLDLTEGIKLFQALGLEFFKTDGEAMRFNFTQLDAADPSRDFYFLLLVDSNDKYQLLETNPVVAPSVCAVNLAALNKDNNLSRFMFAMRKAFQALV